MAFIIQVYLIKNIVLLKEATLDSMHKEWYQICVHLHGYNILVKKVVTTQSH